MEELKGTVKQIAWAEKIREDILNNVTAEAMPHIFHILSSKTEKTEKFMRSLESLMFKGENYNAYLNNQIVIHEIRQLIENETDAKLFIDNQTILSILKTILVTK
jgi:hypothetical protein